MSTYNTRQRKQVLHSSKEHLNFLEYSEWQSTKQFLQKCKSLYLSVIVFSTVILILDTVNKQTNITNRTEEKKERIPTDRRLNSWLFTKRGGVEIGTTEDKSIQ